MWPETHQGAGLLGYLPEVGPRLLPVLAHPQATLELEVLWQLARQLRRLGRSTLVLDANAAESASEPGLAQWLNGQTDLVPESASEPVVAPALQGVSDLVGRQAALERLAGMACHFDAVLVYASPAQVGDLFVGAEVSPLVINVPGEAALMRSYTVLKQMAGLAGWPCTLACVALDGGQAQAVHQALHALRQCARQWLDSDLRAVSVQARDEEAFGALALQLMEGACTVRTLPEWRAQVVPQRAITRYHEHSVV